MKKEAGGLTSKELLTKLAKSPRVYRPPDTAEVALEKQVKKAGTSRGVKLKYSKYYPPNTAEAAGAKQQSLAEQRAESKKRWLRSEYKRSQADAKSGPNTTYSLYYKPRNEAERRAKTTQMGKARDARVAAGLKAHQAAPTIRNSKYYKPTPATTSATANAASKKRPQLASVDQDK